MDWTLEPKVHKFKFAWKSRINVFEKLLKNKKPIVTSLMLEPTSKKTRSDKAEDFKYNWHIW